MNNTIKNAIWLLMLAVILGLATNTFSPAGIPLFGQWDESEGMLRANPVNVPSTLVVEMDNIEDAKKIYDQGGAVFIDARSGDDYQEAHIDGAISLPAWEFDEKFADLHRDRLAQYDALLEVHTIEKANHILAHPEWFNEMLDISRRWLERFD